MTRAAEFAKRNGLAGALAVMSANAFWRLNHCDGD
jgi:hypothetical protein